LRFYVDPHQPPIGIKVEAMACFSSKLDLGVSVFTKTCQNAPPFKAGSFTLFLKLQVLVMSHNLLLDTGCKPIDVVHPRMP